MRVYPRFSGVSEWTIQSGISYRAASVDGLDIRDRTAQLFLMLACFNPLTSGGCGE
jgi:hypothetical protein